MRIQRKEQKKFFTFLIAILILAIISFYNKSFAIQNYQEVDFGTGLVTASTLNVRCGPGLAYRVTSKVHKNEYVRVFAKINNWYVIQTDKDIVGAVYASYIKPIKSATEQTNATPEKEETIETGAEPVANVENSIENSQTEEEKNEDESSANIVIAKKECSSELTKDEQEVFDLINSERKNAGLSELKIDDDLQNVCRIKADDMVKNDYFSHNSPIYGSPFDMIKKNTIEYKVAGENIAGNSVNSKAVQSWMNSENHRDNILNNAYNYTGVAVVNSPKYGKIFVQMFIGK